ncbi:hypothetical protein [Longivirga aurantiaca]|uniref:DUF420 domain-containing protein n=1 Tax=Longivirga aurantiaca TaxID=1837743 RepID=A0ABW1SZ55_9ACTN
MSQAVTTRAAVSMRSQYSVPLLALALAVAGAMPFYIMDTGSAPGAIYSTNLGGLVDTAIGLPVNVYWLLALPMAYAAVAVWAARRGQQGEPARVKPLVVTGLIALVAVISVQVLAPSLLHGDLTGRSLTPLLSIAVAIAAWAVTERSIGLGVTAALVAAASLVANLYDVVNVLQRLAIDPAPQYSLAVNIALVALTLGIASAVFAFRARSAR